MVYGLIETDRKKIFNHYYGKLIRIPQEDDPIRLEVIIYFQWVLFANWSVLQPRKGDSRGAPTGRRDSNL